MACMEVKIIVKTRAAPAQPLPQQWDESRAQPGPRLSPTGTLCHVPRLSPVPGLPPVTCLTKSPLPVSHLLPVFMANSFPSPSDHLLAQLNKGRLQSSSIPVQVRGICLLFSISSYQTRGPLCEAWGRGSCSGRIT